MLPTLTPEPGDTQLSHESQGKLRRCRNNLRLAGRVEALENTNTCLCIPVNPKAKAGKGLHEDIC